MTATRVLGTKISACDGASHVRDALRDPAAPLANRLPSTGDA